MKAGHPTIGQRYAWTRPQEGDMRIVEVSRVSPLMVHTKCGERLSLARWYMQSALGQILPVPSYDPTPTDDPAGAGMVQAETVAA